MKIDKGIFLIFGFDWQDFDHNGSFLTTGIIQTTYYNHQRENKLLQSFTSAPLSSLWMDVCERVLPTTCWPESVLHGLGCNQPCLLAENSLRTADYHYSLPQTPAGSVNVPVLTCRPVQGDI
jgi:hypothetical protein